MMDALGQPQSVLVLGGTSEIAREILLALPHERLRRVYLAGRSSGELESSARFFETALATGDQHPAVKAIEFDAARTPEHAGMIDGVFADGDVDLVILAFGVLGDQTEFESNPSAAVEAAQVNYVGAVSVGLEVAKHLTRQGHGTLVVLSSVAGVRARRSNFVYGSTKAGLDAFSQGLADALVNTGARVMVVRPGFVRTRMTTGLAEAPMTVNPSDVANAVVRGLHANDTTVYVPRQMILVATVLKTMPRALLRRLNM